ncbi:hypothetical protein AX15_003398 [Amanita polypyramis BW_CC]|nr:hypothetical protein AX15_003398 [Amanita polypyramis BW_CC]
MMILLRTFLSFWLAIALAPVLVSAQNLTFIAGFIDSLLTLGYSDFAQALIRVNGTTVGDEILSLLPNGNFTVFVPSNQAFSTFNSTNATASSDAATLANLLAYHILPGDFLQPNATSPTGGNVTTNATLISATFPNSTIGRTLLNNDSFVQLEGNKSQVLAWTIFPSNTSNVTEPTILNQPGVPNITVFNATTHDNLLLAFVTGVFNPPQNLTTVLANNNLTAWSGVLNATTITNSSGTNATILSGLETQRGYTAFIPSDQALSTFNLSSFEGNITNLAIVAQNHVSFFFFLHLFT